MLSPWPELLQVFDSVAQLKVKLKSSTGSAWMCKDDEFNAVATEKQDLEFS